MLFGELSNNELSNNILYIIIDSKITKIYYIPRKLSTEHKGLYVALFTRISHLSHAKDAHKLRKVLANTDSPLLLALRD